MLSNMIVLGVGLCIVIQTTQDQAGIAGLVLNYTVMLSVYLTFVVRTVTDTENNVVSIERISEYLRNDREAEWDKPEVPLDPNWPARGEVKFDKYSTRYRPELPLAIKKVSFQIDSGEKIGVVGRSGAGKSSVAMSLFRLIEAVDGHVEIDQVDITKLGLHSLRGRLGIIPQDPALFSGSVRFNLDPFDQHQDDRLWHALRLCHLAKWVANHPAGLQIEVGEKGQSLSVGQRQLLCLARALLRQSKVLVLDEATASVDQVTDLLIQQTIRSEFADCTVITIAHRLHTIADSSRILVLEQGQVVEFDTPDNLVKNSNSLYRSLLDQAGLLHASANSN
jgi:ABC-type multidrug transport system fused ATPase/permease subunit